MVLLIHGKIIMKILKTYMFHALEHKTQPCVVVLHTTIRMCWNFSLILKVKLVLLIYVKVFCVRNPLSHCTLFQIIIWRLKTGYHFIEGALRV